MSAFLNVTCQDGAAARYELGASTAIGRSRSNQIFFVSDQAVSRHHALIRRQGDNEFCLIDLGSANGTLVNSQLLVRPVILKNGDEIRIGHAVLVFELVHDAGVCLDPTQGGDESSDVTMMTARLETAVILVCDIRDFSRISETLRPDKLAKFLGSWFQKVCAIVDEHHGVVDKFLGDAVMAYWLIEGADGIGAAQQAVEAAIGMHHAAAGIRIAEHAELPFRIGVGINEGEVSLGNVGLKSQRDFTILGDAVNVAFRLENVCKERHIPIVVGAGIRKRLAEKYSFLSLGEVFVKGKSDPMEVFGLSV
jgi:adenylate cyclase